MPVLRRHVRACQVSILFPLNRALQGVLTSHEPLWASNGQEARIGAVVMPGPILSQVVLQHSRVVGSAVPHRAVLPIPSLHVLPMMCALQIARMHATSRSHTHKSMPAVCRHSWPAVFRHPAFDYVRQTGTSPQQRTNAAWVRLDGRACNALAAVASGVCMLPCYARTCVDMLACVLLHLLVA